MANVNVIKNFKWQPGPAGGPQFFSGTGPITYDKLSIEGYRTCSITMTTPGTAQDFYEPLIDAKGQFAITYGFNIRTVDADNILYVAEFFDVKKAPLSSMEKNITQKVKYNFNMINAQFVIPKNAAYVRLSIKFTGKITACTYWAPHAEFV
jgi:hypothetical protein